MKRTGTLLAASALLTVGAIAAAACGADDREMDQPSTGQTTTSLVRGTTTTVAGIPTVTTVTTIATSLTTSTTSVIP